MTRTPNPTTQLDVQRLRIDAHGYDHDGAYWGAGPDVFIVTAPDGDTQQTVRAKTVTEARRHAAKAFRAAGLMDAPKRPGRRPAPVKPQGAKP
jgi:hypothetical protein